MDIEMVPPDAPSVSKRASSPLLTMTTTKRFKLDVPQDELNSLNVNLNHWSKLQPAPEDAAKWLSTEWLSTMLNALLASLEKTTAKDSFISPFTPGEAERFVEGFNPDERREWVGGIKMCIESGDWSDLITHPRLQPVAITFAQHRFPSGISPDRKRRVTPSSEVLEIDALKPLIQETLDIIRPTIETFLENPELPDWVPPPSTKPNVSDFIRNLKIPAYQNGSPSLLYHDLHSHHGDVGEIFGRVNDMFVCNTSGSGKTRRILEGLTEYWGLYFVAARDNNGVGVDDLEAALGNVEQYEDWTRDVRLFEGQDRTNRSDYNICISKRAIQKVVAARLAVFRLFLQLATARNGNVGPEHKRLWLLFQLSNPLPGSKEFHPFVTMMDCLDRASDGALTILIKDFRQIRMQYFPQQKFVIAVDEAQEAVRRHRFCCLSSGEPTKFRSILREIVKVLSSLPVKIVVSGTGLSLEEVEDALNSSVGKPREGRFETFVELGMFDDPPKLEATLQRYIPSSMLESSSGKSLRMRIREYLPGRYRFLISFLELFLRNGLESPHTLLNSYLAQYLDCSPGDMDFYAPLTSGEPPLQVKPKVRGFDWERLRENPLEIREIASIVQSHLIKKSTPTFGPLVPKYVEYGIAYLSDDHRGEIIEPLAFLSIVRWLQTQNGISLEANLRPPLADEELRGHACECMVILFLVRTFCRPTVLSSVFKFHGAVPEWADMPTQMVVSMEHGEVGVNLLENQLRYPSLGVVYYASTIEGIIRWFEDSPAPSVLVPTHLFGPDVIIKCAGGLHLIGRTQSCLTSNINELNATTTAAAINSLNSANWFIKTKSQLRKQKLIDTIQRFPILFFLAGFPLSATLDLAADPVKKAVSDLGPVPLATIPLDTFRAKFISPGETNVLQPMEHALACKRGLDTIMH